MTRPTIAITMGDPAGIGPEVIMKALAKPEAQAICNALVIGDAKRLRKAGELVGVKLAVDALDDAKQASFASQAVQCVDLKIVPEDLPFGKMSPVAGEAAYRYIEKAVELVQADLAQGICTAPLWRMAIDLSSCEGGHLGQPLREPKMLRRSILTGAASLLMMTVPLVAAGRTTSLHAAAGENDVITIKKLLTEGAEIDARDSHGATALLVATHGNRVEAARALIEAGADVNARDRINDSPYLYAGARGHLEILTMTLRHAADLKSTNRYGGTALIPAAERGHVETVRTLIEVGVDVDHVNNLAWTALLEAVILGDGGERHQRIVDLLFKAGADVNLADGKGVTPLQHARLDGHNEIAAILLAAKAR